jgi:large subunit ribosomal protein L23
MRTAYDIIKRPVISEASMSETEAKKYVFEVDVSANKTEIRKAIEEIFGVEVLSVNTMRTLGKLKRMGVHKGYRPERKKAIVRLTEKSKTIEFFEGMV